MRKILIIKLGALGDVIRTLPLAAALKQRYPESEITWITKKSSEEILRGNKSIDKLFTLPYERTEEFDALYNFDIEEEATQLASRISAKEKFGFYSNAGYASAFNLGAEYYLNTLFDDQIKKENTKTYQEMMFEAAEIPYKKEIYKIELTEQDRAFEAEFKKKSNLENKQIVGLHIGSSPRWPSKAWSKENVKLFIRKVKESGKEVILFGGPDEAERHRNLANELEAEGISVFTNNPRNTSKEFASLVSACDLMICGDSLALHVAIGLAKPTIGLFFCTSPNEVEPYDLLKKLVSPKLNDFFPEKMDQYDEGLTKSITAGEVFSALEQIRK